MTQSTLTKLESASEGSRELDAEIAIFFQEPTEEELYYKPWTVLDDGPSEGPGCYFVHTRSGRMMRRAPEYTASIDAAVALIEKVLKPTRVSIHDHIGGASAEIVVGLKEYEAHSLATAPIALLICLLKALETGGEDD